LLVQGTPLHVAPKVPDDHMLGSPVVFEPDEGPL
jgi:hypothetical protein